MCYNSVPYFLSKKFNIQVYKAVVLHLISYECEIWFLHVKGRTVLDV